MTVRILLGDARALLVRLASESVHCIVTSPPYFGLRDYDCAGQIGLEATPSDYVAALVEVFREARRVLRSDGTCWVNLGDSYAGSWGAQSHRSTPATISRNQIANHPKRSSGTGSIRQAGLKPKDLIGIPWMVAFALRADGWWLRQEIIWSKPNPMPESVEDRCTKAHESLFLLAKSDRYWFDAEAIAEPIAAASVARLAQDVESQAGSLRVSGKSNGPMRAVRRSGNKARKPGSARGCPEGSGANVCGSVPWEGGSRNKRSVWTVATQPFRGPHFATFPPLLVEPCILAGCPAGGVVLDPFLGAGTTALGADRLGRDCIGVELHPGNVEMARARLVADGGMLMDCSVVAA